MFESNILKINMIALTVVGVLNLQTSKKFSIKNFLHTIYSWFVRMYFVTFVLAEYIEMFRTPANDIFSMVSILGVALLYTIVIIKIFICRGTQVANLITHIEETEKNILQNTDEEVKSIYWKYIKLAQIVSKGFMFLGVVTIFPFYISAKLTEMQNPPDKLFDIINGTKIYRARPLPFITYFPFDKYKYYEISYTLHIFFGTIGASLTVTTDTLFYTLLIYARSQIEILQRHLTYFKLYSKLWEANYNFEKDTAIEKFIIKCIYDHRVIIKYIEDLDNTIKYVMLLDFGMASMQMAMLIFQIIYVGFSLQQLFTAEYLLAMLIQLFLFYWHANEILLETAQVSTAVYNSDWFDCSQKMKKTFLLIMMRASKPSTLNVGPFYAMSTATALSILRAAYSYAALMRQTYLRNKD